MSKTDAHVITEFVRRIPNCEQNGGEKKSETRPSDEQWTKKSICAIFNFSV